MLGLLLVGMAVATAVLTALAARLSSLVSTLLLAYLAFVANLVLVTLVLSPFREVTRGGLAVAEVVLLAGAARGVVDARPAAAAARGGPGGAARGRARARCSAAFVGLVALVLLVVRAACSGLTVPPNNGDSLAYHLAKAAAWAQHGGFFWVPNAPTVRMNAFQPLAEQQILFLFVATGTGALYALPQFVAELAILVAVYGAARRLGFEVRAAASRARSSLATFSLVALEATTAQNDLVAASFPVVAACLLLGPGRLEPALGGRGRGARPRREAHDRARAAGPRLARARARPAHGRVAGVVGGRRRLRRARHVGLRAQPRPHGARASAPAPTRCSTARSPVVPRERRERRLPRSSGCSTRACSRSG